MPKSNLETTLESAQLLRGMQRWHELRLTLIAASNMVTTSSGFEQLHATAQDIPLEIRVLPEWCIWLIRWACNARAVQAVLELTHAVSPAQQAIFAGFRGWALIQTQEYELALQTVNSAPSDALEPGLVWRVRAEALARLNRSGWENAFLQARALLTARALGICLMEQGSQYFLRTDYEAARRFYSQSFALLKDDPLYGAWLKSHLGLLCLQQGLPEAESHFLEMQKFARHNDAKLLRSRAWCYLAASRRVLGEWDRAEAAYQEAFHLAKEDDDRFEARRGLGYSYRLAGQTQKALEVLHSATTWRKTSEPREQVDIAAVLIMQHDQTGALEVIEKIASDIIKPQHVERLQIVKAELYRQQGNIKAALELLQTVSMTALWTREEARCFPALFALAAAQGRHVLKPLIQSNNIVVEVRAMGALRVLVNDRLIPIKSISRAGEVLVALLENGKEISTEQLANLLYPRLGKRQGMQALSKQISTLRDALGWNKSLTSEGGITQLDPEVIWDYDVETARKSNKPIKKLLEGVYSEWLTQRQHNLNPN
jgi:tetratricopeptide (TPR) repeat protein